MSNQGSGIKQIGEETGEVIKEVVKEVKDAVGEMMEQGVQSVAGKTLTPQQINQKQQDEQQRLTRARKVIQYYKDLETSIKNVREERKQKEIQRLEQIKQEDQAKKASEQSKKQTFTSPKGKQDLREDIARTQAERGKGRGVGG